FICISPCWQRAKSLEPLEVGLRRPSASRLCLQNVLNWRQSSSMQKHDAHPTSGRRLSFLFCSARLSEGHSLVVSSWSAQTWRFEQGGCIDRETRRVRSK